MLTSSCDRCDRRVTDALTNANPYKTSLRQIGQTNHWYSQGKYIHHIGAGGAATAVRIVGANTPVFVGQFVTNAQLAITPDEIKNRVCHSDCHASDLRLAVLNP
jgi:hypothetical protein